MTTLVHAHLPTRRLTALLLPLSAVVVLIAVYAGLSSIEMKVPRGAAAAALTPTTVGAVVPLPAHDWIAGVRPDGPRSRIDFAQLSTGAALATLEVGFSVMAVTRRSANEILLSDVVADSPNGAGLPHPRLWVLDARTLAIKAGPIPLPDRSMYTLYATGLLLSSDQRYLYYIRRIECGVGCDDYSVGIMDLASNQLAATAALPRGCGWAELTPARGTTVAALCPGYASIWTVERSGATKEVADFNVRPGDHPIHGGVAANGDTFLLTQRGHLQVKDARGSLRVDRDVVTAPQRLSGLDRLPRANGHDVLGVMVSADIGLVSLLTVDRTTWITRTVELPAGVTHMTAADGDHVLAIGAGRPVVVNRGGSTRSLPARSTQIPAWSFTFASD